MSNFLANIAARHMNTVPQVQPRIPGRFEIQQASSVADPFPGFELNMEKKGVKELVENNREPLAANSNKEVLNSFVDAKSVEPGLLIRDETVADDKIGVNRNHLLVSTNKKESKLKALPTESKQSAMQAISHDESLQIMSGEERKIVSSNNLLIDSGNTYTFNENLLQQNHFPTNLTVLNEAGFPAVNTSMGDSVIKVSIGRIDVRAITSPTTVKTSSSTSQQNKMSLDDYFKRKK